MNFYKSAALALDHLEKNQGSVKGSLAAAGVKATPGEAKRILALVIETLKYKSTLQQLLTTVPLSSLERLTFPRKVPRHVPSSSSLLLVLTHDLLYSPRGVEASDKWPPKQALTRHQARLKAELVRLQLKAGVSRKEDLAKSSTEVSARYVRWNPNVDLHRSGDWSIEALFSHLKTKGFERITEPVYPVTKGKYFMDPHLPDCLLVFPPSTNWWVGDKWYEAGAVILQDKASCFPAKVLMEGWTQDEGECIDATAAPGNKTSYISALMSSQSRLLAFERSAPRFTTLEKMLAKGQCRNVIPRRADFTDSDPLDPEFAKVTRILLDPSCSGSGIVNRLDYLLEDEVDEPDAQSSRLEKLASFQLQMILHAFRFPSARRVVYSTCSIHAEEDERVVLAAVSSGIAEERGWRLADRSEVLPTWERRGRPEETGGDEQMAESVIRCLPGEDKTNGFFVACFVRNEGETDGPQLGLKKKAGAPQRGANTRDQAEHVTKHGNKRKRDEADTVIRDCEAFKDPGQKSKTATPAKIAKTAKKTKALEAPEAADDEEDVTMINGGDDIGARTKTSAQVERARRKKAAQREKKKLKVNEA